MDERYPEETQTLRELLALMHEHDLDTIKVKLGDAIYELSRASSEPAPQADGFSILHRRPMPRRTSTSAIGSKPATCCACSKR